MACRQTLKWTPWQQFVASAGQHRKLATAERELIAATTYAVCAELRAELLKDLDAVRCVELLDATLDELKPTIKRTTWLNT